MINEFKAKEERVKFRLGLRITRSQFDLQSNQKDQNKQNDFFAILDDSFDICQVLSNDGIVTFTFHNPDGVGEVTIDAEKRVHEALRRLYRVLTKLDEEGDFLNIFTGIK